MKRIPAIFTAFLAATHAYGGNCDKSLVQADANFTPMQATDPVEIVAFCEPANGGNGTDYIVDVFVLGQENNQINVFIHEFVASSPTGSFNDEGWWKVPQDLTGNVTSLGFTRAARSGNCLNPGDFTRSVQTGSGIGPKKAGKHKKLVVGGGGFFGFCGHGNNIKYTTTPK